MERILKKSPSDRPDTATGSDHRFAGNPHSVKNVNQPQGPRHGNEGAHTAKRGNFLDAKAERAPLAEMVTGAFSKRARELEANPGEHEVPESGQIEANSQIKRFTARKSRYKD